MVATLKPTPADCVDSRRETEVLNAAERAGWPDVYIQPEQRTVMYERALNVRVSGMRGWRVFAQLMTGPQLLAAQRLLLLLLSGQRTDELFDSDGILIGPDPSPRRYVLDGSGGE